jgi:hypothetical protein
LQREDRLGSRRGAPPRTREAAAAQQSGKKRARRSFQGEAQAAIRTMQMKTEADPHANLNSWVDRPPLGRPVSLADLKRQLVEARTARAGYYQVAAARVSLVLRSGEGGMPSCTLGDVIDQMDLCRRCCSGMVSQFATGGRKGIAFHQRTLSTKAEDGQVLESEVVQIDGQQYVHSWSTLNDPEQSVFDVILEDFTVTGSHPFTENMQIDVKTLQGRTLSFSSLSPASTIDHVKSMVQDKIGIPPDQQGLLYEGRRLDADGGRLTLAENGVPNHATLNLLMPNLRGGMFHPTSGVNGLVAANTEKPPVLVTLGEAKVEMDESTTLDNVLAILREERAGLDPSLLESVDELDESQKEELIKHLTSRKR